MNAIDLYGLKNRDLTETEVSFTRHKTANTQKNDTKTTVVIPELSKLIMGKYGKIDKNFPNDFVFSTFSHGMPELQKQYRKESENKKINKGLALICEELGLSRKYTVGGARHSQATYLHDEGVDTKIIDDISNRMSHSSTGMTEKHYIARSQRRKELIKGLLDNLVHETPYFNKDVFFKED